MKMSEFTTKSFLGNAGAAENSYILINYEDNSTSRPVTYKASLQEIGKAIANDQKLYKKTQNGAVTTTTDNGAYVNGTAENFASVGAVNSAVSGLASTGYVTNALARLGASDVGAINDVTLQTALTGLASTGYVTSAINTATSGLATTSALAAKANASTVNALSLAVSTKMNASQVNEAISTAISDLASAGYVTSAIQTATRNKIMMDDDKLYYYNSEGSIDAVTIDMISGAVTPSNMELNGDTLSYLLINGSVDTYYKDDQGTWHNVGCSPAFYNANNDRLVDIGGNYINIGDDPYTVSVSEWTMNYMIFDSTGGQAVIADSTNYEIIGHPLFFNETENKIGYYENVSGERVWHAVSSLT